MRRLDASTGLSASKLSDRARIVVAALGVERLGQAEVEDLHLAVVSDLDVGGLEVAMDDAAFVRLFKGLGDLLRDRDGLIDGNRTAPQSLREVFAFDELQDERHNRRLP